MLTVESNAVPGKSQAVDAGDRIGQTTINQKQLSASSHRHMTFAAVSFYKHLFILRHKLSGKERKRRAGQEARQTASDGSMTISTAQRMRGRDTQKKTSREGAATKSFKWIVEKQHDRTNGKFKSVATDITHFPDHFIHVSHCNSCASVRFAASTTVLMFESDLVHSTMSSKEQRRRS